MKKYIIFLIGCFLIGFGAAAFGTSMLISFENFLIVVFFDAIWAIALYSKEVYKMLKLK